MISHFKANSKEYNTAHSFFIFQRFFFIKHIYLCKFVLIMRINYVQFLIWRAKYTYLLKNFNYKSKHSISHIFLKFQLDLSKTSNITAQYLASSTLCTFQNSSKIQCDKICPVCSEGREWSPHMDLNLGLQGTKHALWLPYQWARLHSVAVRAHTHL